MVKLTRFAYIFDNNKYEHIALYHSIKLSPIFLERGSIDIISKLKVGLDIKTLSSKDTEFVNQLIELGFVIDDDKANNEEINTGSCLKPNLTIMYLILTDRCNLGCKYCFVEANFPTEYVCNDMNLDIAKKSIDIFTEQRNKNSECQIWLYGGEPFLMKDLLFQCLDYLAEHDPEVVPVIVSNGTVITPEIAAKLATYPKVQLSISLDGPKEIHDQKRVYKSGKGSYSQVRKGIKHLQEANVRFGISCTIAEHNVDHISEVADWICKEIGIASLGMNLLVDTPRAYVEEEYMHKANNGLIDFYKIARKNNIYEDRIHRKVDAFVNGRARWHDCAACGNQIVISPLGEIGICHEGLGERNAFIGSIYEPFDFANDPQIQDWARRSPASMPECVKCEALGICGGGCPYGALLKRGSIWEIDKRFCIHSKETLEWLIWDLYDNVMARTKLDV